MSKRKVIDGHFDHGARKKQFNPVLIKKHLNAIGYKLDFDDESDAWSVSSLTEKTLSVESLKKLLNLLKTVKMAIQLDLGYNSIGDKGAIALAQHLKDTNVTTLNLSFSDIGDKGAIALAKCLKDTNVTALHLGENSIGDKGATALAQCLKDTNVTILSLIDNNIGDEGATALAQYLKDTNITTLNLSIGNIGDKGTTALAKCLKDTNITTLNLSHNKIGNKGATALAQCLKDTNITFLELLRGNIGDEEITAFRIKIDTHKTSLAQITTELIEKNSPTPIKQLEFYVTINQASLQEYLQNLGLKYNSTMLSAKAQDILSHGYDFLLEQLSSFIYKEPGKITIEYCGKDLLLSLITTDSDSSSTSRSDSTSISSSGSSTSTISSSETTSGISMFNISFEQLSNLIMNPSVIETSTTTEIELVGEEPL